MPHRPHDAIAGHPIAIRAAGHRLRSVRARPIEPPDERCQAEDAGMRMQPDVVLAGGRSLAQ